MFELGLIVSRLLLACLVLDILIVWAITHPAPSTPSDLRPLSKGRKHRD